MSTRLRATAVRALRRVDAAVAERVADAVLPARSPRPLRVGCVFVRWEPVRADAAFTNLQIALQRLHSDVAFCVVDNRDESAPPSKDGAVLHVGGDNRWREFSAWDRGIAALRSESGETYDVWILANDRYEAVESPLLAHLSDASLEAAWRSGCMVGRVDAYPRAVELDGVRLDHWVCTALMVIPDALLREVEPLAHVTQPVVDSAFAALRRRSGDAPAQAEALDPRHVAYLREWLTGDGDALDARWYRSADPAAGGDEQMRGKLASILNEQSLSARVLRHGHTVAGIGDVEWSARLGAAPPAGAHRVPRGWSSLRAPQVIGAAARRRAGVQRFSAVRLRPAVCTVCGGVTAVVFRGGSPRESWTCLRCRSSNRQRQVAAVLCDGDLAGRRHRSLAAYARDSGESVYLAEQRGPLHDALSHGADFIASEFVDPDAAPGTVVDGVLHQDLQDLSFGDGRFDLVVTTDVLEHVPDPYRAHREILRVLRPGGRHVFTVPFDEGSEQDDLLAVLGEDGEVRHLAPPQYHLDPLRPEGVLVFTIFGQRMCETLERLGFEVTVHRPDRACQGIFGPGAVVFEARRKRA
jgi:SAM-dependent methyltransferase